MTESQAKKCRMGLVALVIVLAIAQVILHPSASNLISVLIVFAFSIVVIFSMVRANIFKNYPISSLQILVFWLATELLAIVGTLFDGMALVDRLDHPEKTFLLISITGVALIVAHWIYRGSAFQLFRRTLTVRFVGKIGIFRTPTGLQLWMIAGVGMVAMFLIRIAAHGQSDEGAPGGGALAKFLQGLIVFAYVPYVIPFLAGMQRSPQRLVLKDFFMPGIWFLLTAGVSIAANMRGAMVLPIITIIFVVILLIVTGQLSLSAIDFKVWIIGGIVGLLVMTSLADLALAMQAARSQRGKLSPEQMVQLSLSIYADRDLLSKFKEGEEAERHLAVWDEVYVNNPFLARFLTTKYDDLCLGLEEKFDPVSRDKLREFNWVRIMSIYPAPLVNLLPLGYHKSGLGIVSCGDFMFFLTTGSGLGGFRTGSFIAEGLGMWGMWFFPILAIIAILVFILSDSLILTPQMQTRLRPGMGLLTVPFVAMLNIYPFCNMFQTEGIDAFLNFLLRGYWQIILLYALLAFVTKPFAARAGLPNKGRVNSV
jgi:hypothetical protein